MKEDYYLLTLLHFSNAMEEKLKRNLHKSEWDNFTIKYLFNCLLEETKELKYELDQPYTTSKPDLVLYEAADVANFAMMIADVIRKRNNE
jgi:hypothetical protein